MTIGGPTNGDANYIVGGGRKKRARTKSPATRARNSAGLFIDLIGATTNGGIQSSAFAPSLQSSATGTGAEPGATVRVFRKASAEVGESQSFLKVRATGNTGKPAKKKFTVLAS